MASDDYDRPVEAASVEPATSAGDRVGKAMPLGIVLVLLLAGVLLFGLTS